MLMSASGESVCISIRSANISLIHWKSHLQTGTRDMDKTGGIEHSADALGYPVHRRYPVKTVLFLVVLDR